MARLARLGRWMLGGALLALGSCFGDGADGAGMSHGAGRILIDWTVGGAPASAASCAGIDRLELTLDDGFRRVTIKPITCALTRFRYDNLPEGRAVLRLEALDAAGCRVAAATTPVTVAAALPPAPSPTVAIPAPTPCR